jgi:hypothetical protein
MVAAQTRVTTRKGPCVLRVAAQLMAAPAARSPSEWRTRDVSNKAQSIPNVASRSTRSTPYARLIVIHVATIQYATSAPINGREETLNLFRSRVVAFNARSPATPPRRTVRSPSVRDKTGISIPNTVSGIPQRRSNRFIFTDIQVPGSVGPGARAGRAAHSTSENSDNTRGELPQCRVQHRAFPPFQHSTNMRQRRRRQRR